MPERVAICPETQSRSRGGDEAMVWETPECVEIKMDAELSSYQEDLAG
jgi:hypothetical protein